MCHYSERHNVEYLVFTVTLSAVMLSVFMVNVVAPFYTLEESVSMRAKNGLIVLKGVCDKQ